MPGDGDGGRLVLAVLPWLGVPVLVSAALAEAGHPLPGEVLPVVAFLPLTLIAYLAAVRLPGPGGSAAVGLAGWVALAGLLAFVAREPGAGAARTFWAALAAAVVCTGAAAALGWMVPRAGALATAAGGAMVFSQGLDGWLTYLAVDNPFGWLPSPVMERVWVSRQLLEWAPALYPVLKVGLAATLAFALLRNPGRAPANVLLALCICYVGLSPAMFSAANLFGR